MSVQKSSLASSSTPSVQDLVSRLESSFSVEYRNLVTILTDRDQKMKKELLELQQKCKLIKKEKNLLLLENLKLKDDLEKKKENNEVNKVIEEYEGKIKVLETEKAKLESEVGAYKKKFVELHKRVSRAEKIAQELKGESSRNVNGSKHPDFVVLNDDNEDQEPISSFKRKRVIDGNTIPNGREETKNFQGPNHLFEASCSPHSGGIRYPCGASQSIFGVDDERVNGPLNSVMKSERWSMEAEMIVDFAHDNLLCLDAVCALYRWRLQGKSLSYEFTPPYDISRVSELGRFLTDGDPELKRKKEISELEGRDLADCRMIAVMYAEPLYNIVKKREDPFFPS